MNYENFIEELDIKLKKYFLKYEEYIKCKKGCSSCCEIGDYPISLLEFNYLMQGYMSIDNGLKFIIKDNIAKIEKGGKCPFLIEKMCAIYKWRPIICRVHGLAYLCKEKTVKLPFCVNEGKNFAEVYKNNEFIIEPICQNLDTHKILEGVYSGEIKNLYDWLNLCN